jgi:hypothetical protein
MKRERILPLDPDDLALPLSAAARRRLEEPEADPTRSRHDHTPPSTWKRERGKRRHRNRKATA